jgi:hypothetical protein
MRTIPVLILMILLIFCFPVSGTGQPVFGAWYTKINTGQEWEAFSRTGEHSDIIVSISKSGGKLVFWEGNSYLPYWQTDKGKWNLAEIIPRTGDGLAPMPDRNNVYSNVRIIENTSSKVVIHLRYLASFAKGNPHGDVNPCNFTEEVFTVTNDGIITRVIRKGTEKTDEWNDPLNKTVQTLKLNRDGIVEVSLTKQEHSAPSSRIKGNPILNSIDIQPVVWFNFDEGNGDQAKENITGIAQSVPGHKTLWKKGISGASLEFDGYNTLVSLPASNVPTLSGGNLTLEGWVALGAYPWNWAPIIQQGDNDGYFLGVNSHGYPGFMLKVNGIWEQLTVPDIPPFADANHLSLFKWYHIAGTYNMAEGRMSLYLNGNEIAGKQAGTGGVQTVPADLRIGKAGILREPTEGTNINLPSNFGIDGLIDEIKVYSKNLSSSQIKSAFERLKNGNSIIDSPDMQRRKFPEPSTNGQFKAVYTHLPYYESWENMFRFGDYADVVVGFDKSPVKFVFWRGVSYIPMIVNESNQWFTNEFSETGFTKEAPGDCEPMSDKGSWDSHVRVIENNDARVVVSWRYRLTEPGHHWANYNDTTGWGDIAEWDYYIYPDGVVAKVMRCYSSQPDSWYEWDEQMVILGEGQHPESVMGKTPVMTLVDSSGKATDYDWNPDPPDPQFKGQIIHKINFTGKYDPFTIQNFTGGDIYKGERTWYSVFPVWNHWPTAQVNSSGRNASFTDRAAHSSVSHLFWPVSLQQRGKIPFEEKLLLEGMTDKPAESLTGLARSWMNAPAVTNVSGATSYGYNQSHRAYVFSCAKSAMSFLISASSAKPIHNLCFEIRNWGNSQSAGLLINGEVCKAGSGFRQGKIIDTDGTYTMIIWVELESSSANIFKIIKN